MRHYVVLVLRHVERSTNLGHFSLTQNYLLVKIFVPFLHCSIHGSILFADFVQNKNKTEPYLKLMENPTALLFS